MIRVSSREPDTIKLFYRFGTKSYPPIIAKTTNTISQLKSMIACSLQNIDPNKLQIAHRGHVLSNLEWTLSEYDIAQYDTIIAKIDTSSMTRSLFSPKPAVSDRSGTPHGGNSGHNGTPHGANGNSPSPERVAPKSPALLVRPRPTSTRSQSRSPSRSQTSPQSNRLSIFYHWLLIIDY